MVTVPISKAVKPTNNRVKQFEGEREYLATGGLNGNGFSTEKLTYETKPSRADLLVRNNQIIVARMKDTNKVLLIGEDTNNLIVSTGFLVLDVLDGWSPTFLQHYFKSFYFQKQKDNLATGATQKAINNNNFNKIDIPEVPFNKQVIISSYLDQAESLRQKRKQAIDLLDEYLKSVFLEMFGDPVTNPKGWPSNYFKDVSEIKIGPFGSLLHKHDYISGGIPLVNPTHIVDKKIVVDMELTLTEVKHKQLHAYHLKAGDVVLGRRGEIGRCGLVTEKEDGYLCGTGSMFIRPSTEINPLFLVFYISTQSFRQLLESRAIGITMKNLNAGTVQNMVINTPPIELQNKFEQIVVGVENLKLNMLEQSNELDNQFNALMQKSFHISN